MYLIVAQPLPAVRRLPVPRQRFRTLPAVRRVPRKLGRMGDLPNGTYAMSCNGIQVNGNTLTANCLDQAGQYHPASLPLNSCQGGDIANINGVLQCCDPNRDPTSTGCVPFRGTNAGYTPLPAVLQIPAPAMQPATMVPAPPIPNAPGAVATPTPVSNGGWMGLVQQYWWVGALGLGAWLLFGRKR